MKPYVTPACVVCGNPARFPPGSPPQQTCGSKSCDEKLPELNRARWEGHLLRNNVEIKR